MKRLLFLLMLVSTPAFAATKTAVLVVGGDAAEAGELQSLLDARLSRVQGISALKAAEVAFLVGSTGDRIAREKRGDAEDLLQTARRATAEDRLADALESLAELEALQERARGVPVAERVALRSWRASIFLALDDRDRAAAEARQLLALQPYMQVDTTVFRPSVASLVDEVRSGGLPDATVRVEGLPAKAKVTVDERPAGAKFEVITGRHWVTISAPRFRTVERAIDVHEHRSLEANLAIAFEERTRDVLGAAVGARPFARGDRAPLERLAQKLGVDALVIASAGDPARAALWWKGAELPLECPPLPRRAAIGDWAVARLVEGARSPSPSLARIGWLEGFDLDVAAIAGVRNTTAGGARGTAPSARFVRAGTRAGVSVVRDGWVARMSGAMVSDGWRRAPVSGFGERARGGTSGFASAAAGRRIWLGNGESSVVALDALGGIAWEKRDASDPFGSWSAVSPFALVSARVPLEIYGRDLAAVVEAHGSPWSHTSLDGWRTELGFAAGLDWQPRDAWLVGARWEQMQSLTRSTQELAERASAITIVARREF